MSSSKVPAATDVAIIGGGFAGVATAWALARRGIHDVVVLEREPAIGAHASGRGAGLGRQLAEDDETTALTVRGAELLRGDPALAGAWTETGGVLGFDDRAAADLYVARAARFGVACERISGDELAARWPHLASARVVAALHVPSDGVIDVVELLARLQAPVDARVIPDAGVTGIEPGDPCVVHTEKGTTTARIVVDASGAWAGRLVGAPPPTVLRRHVAVLGAELPSAAASTWLWRLGPDEAYVRGHHEGALASACDATPVAPGDYAVDGAAEGQLRARLAAAIPAYAGAALVRQWACARTFTADRRMRLERDAARPWLVWAAGLGGHGATAAAAVGETVAAVVAAALA